LDHRGSLGLLGKRDVLDHLEQGGNPAHRVYLVWGNQARTACLDSQEHQELKAIQDPQVYLESQACLALVNQDSQDPRVIRVWVVHQEVMDLRVIKAMEDCLVCLDLLGQMGSLVPQALLDLREGVELLVLKETKEKWDQMGLMEPREILA